MIPSAAILSHPQLSTTSRITTTSRQGCRVCRLHRPAARPRIRPRRLLRSSGLPATRLSFRTSTSMEVHQGVVDRGAETGSFSGGYVRRCRAIRVRVRVTGETLPACTFRSLRCRAAASSAQARRFATYEDYDGRWPPRSICGGCPSCNVSWGRVTTAQTGSLSDPSAAAPAQRAARLFAASTYTFHAIGNRTTRTVEQHS